MVWMRWKFIHFVPFLPPPRQVERFGEPTWRRLVEAVEDSVGGNDRALAQTIARQHPVSEASLNEVSRTLR